jgi:hypothetical protein
MWELYNKSVKSCNNRRKPDATFTLVFHRILDLIQGWIFILALFIFQTSLHATYQ